MAWLQRGKNKTLNETMCLGQENPKGQSVNEGPEQATHSGSPEPAQAPPGLNRNTAGDHWECEDRISQEIEKIIFSPNKHEE